ncbi:MAG: AsmA family protein [Arenicellales bacterium]|nr:AsmA family protein [Arenicellales bacterium]
MKLVKRLILSVVTVLVVTVTVLALALQYLNWNDHRDALAGWLSVAINREVTISDSLDFQLWPVTRLGVSGLRLASPADTFDVDLLELRNGVIEFDLWSLFSGIAVIDRLQLDGPTLQLAVSADGLANWHFDRPLPPVLGRLVARDVLIQDARLVFAGRDPRLHQDLYLERLTLTLPSRDEGSEAVLTGSLNGAPLTLAGSLTLKDDDLEATLDLSLGAVAGKVHGSVNDLMDGGDADLSLDLKTPDLKNVMQMVVPGWLSARNARLLDGSAALTAYLRGQPDRDLRLENIDITTESALLRLTTSGSLSLVRPGRRGPQPSSRFQVLLETEHLGELVSLYNGRVPFPATAQAQGTLTGSLGEGFRIDDVVANAAGKHARLQATGQVEELTAPDGPWVEFMTQVTTDQLSPFLKAYGLELPHSGRASASAHVSGRPRDHHVNDIDLDIQSGPLTLKATGSIGPLGKKVIYNLPFTAHTDDIKTLVEPFGYTLPLTASGQVEAALSGAHGALALTDLSGEASSAFGTASVTGTIASPFGQADPDLTAQATVGDLSALGPLFDLSLEEYEGIGVTGSARIQHAQGRINLFGLRGEVSGESITIGRFSGEVPDITRWGTASLAIDLEVDDLARFARPLHLNPSYHAPATLKASLVGATEPGAPVFMTLEVSTEALTARVNGQVSALEKDAGFDLKGRFETGDVSAVNHLLDTGFPGEGPLSAYGTVRRARGSDQTLMSSISLDTSDIRASIEGAVDWPPQIGNHVDARIETGSLLNLAPFVPGKYLDPGPVAFSGSLSLGDGRLNSGQFSLTLGNNDLAGSATIKGLNITALPQFEVSPGERLRINGEFQSRRLNLIEIVPAPSEHPKASTGAEPLFNENDLPLEWISGIDLDVELKAGQLVTRKVEAKNLSASIRVQDSVLTGDAVSGEFSGGHFDMNLTVDAHEPQYTTALEFNIDALELDQIPQLHDKDLPLRGQVDVEIDLTGQGKSVKKMLANATGSMSLSARDADLPANAGLDFLTHSIVTQILGFLNRKGRIKLHEIECGEIGFRVVDGKAISRDTIVLQISDVTYLVAGGFSFDDEALDLAIKPIGRGLGVVSSVVSGNEFFRVRGTLQDPKPEPDLKGVFWTGLQAWLVPMTSGASILAPRLWDWWQNQDACGKAKENFSELLRVDEQTVLKAETNPDDTPRPEGN